MKFKCRKFSFIIRNKICDELSLREKNTLNFVGLLIILCMKLTQFLRKLTLVITLSQCQRRNVSLSEKNPTDILAWQFDIVCNGVELSSGAIRNHKRDIMIKAFEIAGYNKNELDSSWFSLMLLNTELHPWWVSSRSR